MKLVELMPRIEKAVEHAKWVDNAKIQQRKFPGLLRSLPETSKVASEQLLNRDFERHFTEECKILRAPNTSTCSFLAGRVRSSERKRLPAVNIALAAFSRKESRKSSCLPTSSPKLR